MRVSDRKDACLEPEGCVSRVRTNFLTLNSKAEPGSLGNPAPPEKGGRDALKLTDRHREVFNLLGEEGRAFAAERISPDFPPKRVNERTLALMTAENLLAVEEWLAERDEKRGIE